MSLRPNGAIALGFKIFFTFGQDLKTTEMKYLNLLSFTAVLVLSSATLCRCQSSPSGTTDQTTEFAPGVVVEVIYEGATAYAGRTDYAFRLVSNGNLMQIGLSNMPEDAAVNPKIPANMLENNKNAEGPPGANPDLLGKTFELVYAEGGDRIIEIRQKQ